MKLFNPKSKALVIDANDKKGIQFLTNRKKRAQFIIMLAGLSCAACIAGNSDPVFALMGLFAMGYQMTQRSCIEFKIRMGDVGEYFEHIIGQILMILAGFLFVLYCLKY